MQNDPSPLTPLSAERPSIHNGLWPGHSRTARSSTRRAASMRPAATSSLHSKQSNKQGKHGLLTSSHDEAFVFILHDRGHHYHLKRAQQARQASKECTSSLFNR